MNKRKLIRNWHRKKISIVPNIGNLILVCASIVAVLTMVIPFSAAAITNNLVTNPSFESGTIKLLNWSLVAINGNIPVWDTIPHTGHRSIKISGNIYRRSGYLKSDLIIVYPLRNYKFSAWGKVNNVGRNPPIVKIVELNNSRYAINSYSINFTIPAWRYKDINFKTKSQTKFIYIYSDINKDPGVFWVDDVSLTNVAIAPPPTTIPSTIKVYRTSTGHIDVVDFKTYIKNVIPNEWYTSWNINSLKSGAMAAKMYGWYRILHPKYPGLGYDVKDNGDDQVYRPNTQVPSADQAVDATWNYLMTKNGQIFESQYDSGSQGSPVPIHPGRLSQWGSEYWAERGYDWQWILHYYYDPIVITGGTVPGPIPGPTPTPSPTPGPVPGPITPATILAKIQPLLIPANRINPNNPLVTTQDKTGPIYIYKLPNTNPVVLVAQSSGAIDCDGQTTAQCNINTDPWYQSQTSFTQSDGRYLIASVLPFYVLPEVGPYFDYTQNNIHGGQLGALLYGNKMSYGVFGDEDGTPNQIGEMSYAMASSLGIDPDPHYGGVSSGVTYIIFTGSVVSPIENHSNAVTMGNTAIAQLMAQLG